MTSAKTAFAAGEHVPTQAATITITHPNLIELTAIPGVFSSASDQISVSTDNYTGYTMSTVVNGSNSLLNTAQGSSEFIPAITLPAGSTSITAAEFTASSWGVNFNSEGYKPLTNGESFQNNAAGSDTYSLAVGVLTDLGTGAGTYEQVINIAVVANPMVKTVTYNANTTDTVNNMPTAGDFTDHGDWITLSSVTPSRSGRTFLGWSTNSASTTAEFAPAAEITLEPLTSNDFVLYAVWGNPCNGICYNNNGGTGTVGAQSSAQAGRDVLLWTTVFKRNGYGFAGWNTAPDGSGTNYGLNETIVMPSSGSLWLYAMWIAPEQGVTLQTFDQTSATYANAATGTIMALTDERDGQVYVVSKLADGNWWMNESLRLNLSNANTTITALNTNNPSSDFVTAVAAKPASANTWCETSNAACVDQILYNTNNTTNGDNGARNDYGVYYNWYTATAGQGTYAKTSGTVTGDICPAGWHLPSGNTNGEFYNLNYAINGNNNVTNSSAAIRAYSNGFLYSGYYHDSAVYDRGVTGVYWSSTAANAGNSYTLNFISGRTTPGNSSDIKQDGYAVRCVANSAHTFTLNYDANGGINAPAADTATDVINHTFTITDAEPTRATYEFLGWSTDLNATTADYEAGDTITTTNPALTLYAVWYKDCEGICYDANGGTGTMATQSATAGNDVVLTASNFSRSGYGFAGWNTRTDGAGTGYGPNETLTVPASGGIWLYANWIASAGSLQNFNCDSLNIGDVTALTDTRDNQTYAVARLADDKCWMIENLRLDLSTSGDQISASNTNNPTSSFVTAASAKPASSDTWCTTDSSSCDDQIVYNDGNLSNAGSDSRYSYGIYYNWYTATAGNGTFSQTSGNAAGDICPAGWHLPTDNAGEFGQLSNAFGGRQNNSGVAMSMDSTTTPTGAAMSNIFRSYPNNFTYSGYYEDTSTHDLGSNGDYWTATADMNGGARYLNFFSDQTHPGIISHSRYGGYTVRCVADYSTVTFDANGGTLDGETSKEVVVAKGQALGNLVPTSGFVRFNKVFIGWNTAADGNGTAVDGTTVPSGDVIYYAQWRDTTFPTIWHQDGVCEFNGKNGVITGSECSEYAGLKYIDTGVSLYNSTNHDQDYEIGFTIVQYAANAQDSGGQETFMNTKLEGSNYPGLVFRRNNSNLEIASRRASNANQTKSILASDYEFNGLTVRIVRRMKANNVQSIYYSLNGSPLTELNNLGSFNPVFDLNVWFGATPTDASATAAQRWLTGKLSNMYIKLGTYEEY